MSRLSSSTLRVGDSSPPLVLPTRDGELVDLSALLDLGSVLLIFVPGTWSPNTRRQLEALEHAHERFQAIGVVPVVVATQDQGRLTKALMHSSPSFLILSDETRDVARDYGVYRVFSWDGIGVTSPSVFLIDRDARIQLIYVGDRDADVPDLETILHLANSLVGVVAEEEVYQAPAMVEVVAEEPTDESPLGADDLGVWEPPFETGVSPELAEFAEGIERAAAEDLSPEAAASEEPGPAVLEDEPEATVSVEPNGKYSELAAAETPGEQGETQRWQPEDGSPGADSQVEPPSSAAGVASDGLSSDPRSA